MRDALTVIADIFPNLAHLLTMGIKPLLSRLSTFIAATALARIPPRLQPSVAD